MTMTSTTTALATTGNEGLSLYRDVWTFARNRFWDSSRADRLDALEHQFDSEIVDLPSARRYAKKMLSTLGDAYTVLLDPDATERRVEQAQDEDSSAASSILANNIGYICISSFSPENIFFQVQRAMKKIQNCDGFIIDLRGNSGGLLSPTVNSLELFVDEGKITTLEQKKADGVTKIAIRFSREAYLQHYDLPTGKTIDTTANRDQCMTTGKPMVILIDKGTCSSAELFAAALLDNGREDGMCISIGAQTYGKGIVQDMHTVSGCSLAVTSGRYLSPTDQWFGDAAQTVANGIVPDIRVSVPAASSTLRLAIDHLCAKLGKEIISRPAEPSLTLFNPATFGWLCLGAMLAAGAMALTSTSTSSART